MHRPYYRRAFLLFAILALEPTTASTARADADSLWDVLTRTGHPANVDTGASTAAKPAQPSRRSLGPVPGFTLPTTGSSENDAIFNKRQRGGGLFGSVGNWFDRLESETGTKISAHGHHTMSFMLESVSGNASAYQDDNYYGRGSNGLYTDSDLDIDATLFKYFHYQTHLSNSLFHNPNDNRLKFDYKSRKMELEYGDINAGFQGNSLIDFNRYLHGFKVTNNWSSKLRTSVLYSTTKADTRTIVIPGNNSSGPYYVYAGQIVEGSDHVRVDNRDLQKGADKDYTLDPITGELNFNHMVVLQSSTIAVSFESYTPGASQGNIMGGRTEYTATKNLHFGLTYVTQKNRGANGLQTYTNSFAGLGPAGSIYVTDYPIDPSRPIAVYIDSLQLPPTAYKVDTSTTYSNRIIILQPALATQTVRITYYPYNSTVTPDSSSVLGVDGRLALGKLGALTMETALSGLSLTGSNISGHAWQFGADLSPFRNFHTNLTVRDVNPTFSSIQTPGFNRNEKSVQISSQYTPIKRLHLSADWEDSLRPSYTGTNQFVPTTNGNDNFKQNDYRLSYDLASNASLSLARSNVSTVFAQGGNSTSTSDILSTNYTLRSLSLTASLSRSVSNVLTSSSELGLPTSNQSQFYTADTSTFSKSFGVHWQPKRWLTLGGTFSDNSITNLGTGVTGSNHSNARDTSLQAGFSLIRNVNIHYSYELSDTGSLGLTPVTGTGTTTGSGAINTSGSGSLLNTGRAAFAPFGFSPFGFGSLTRDVTGTTPTGTTGTSGTTLGTLQGGGINSGLGGLGSYSGYLGTGLISGYGASSFGGRSTAHRLSIDWRPRRNLTLALQAGHTSSVGDYQYNSTQNDINTTFDWQISQRLHLNAVYGIQQLNYTGSLGGSRGHTLVFRAEGHPFGGKFGLILGLTRMTTISAFNLSGTGTTTGTTTGITTGTTSSTPTNTSTDLTSLNFRAEYPISSRQVLFVEMLSSRSSGYLSNQEDDLRFGMDYILTRALKFSLGWQLLSHKYNDTQESSQNYHVSTLLAQFGFNF